MASSASASAMARTATWSLLGTGAPQSPILLLRRPQGALRRTPCARAPLLCRHATPRIPASPTFPCRSVVAPVRASADAPPTSSSGSGSGSEGKEIVPDTEISITKTSFGSIGLAVGLSLLIYGFGAYFQFLPGSEWSALMLTYGFPLTIIGFALKYAELKPVPCTSYADAVALRDKEATPILLQVRSDVTRFRYGDEQHLEEALKRIFRYNQAGGIPRRSAPTLTAIAEEVHDGHYSLLLRFSAPALKFSDFTERQAKLTSFFGPGVVASVEDFGSNEFGVRLTATP